MLKGYEFNKPFEEVKTKSKNKIAYLEKYICLDTETSHNHNEDNPQCWVYQWAFTFNDSIYYGRTPIDLCEKLQAIADFYKLNKQKRVKIFVHNLPYDFSYLVLFFRDYFGEPSHVLAYAPHKPFNVTYTNGLEFNCSYKLSNDSLDRWSKKLNTKHKKLVGTIDYEQIHSQSSQLVKNDWKYMWYDCVVLNECIEKQLAMYNDTIATMPLTSTGYVRREILRAYKGKGKHRYITPNERKFKETALNIETYNVCRQEFSGGITHGNRLMKGITQKGCIRHRDFRSHYPSQQRTQKFAMSRIVRYSNEITIDKLIPLAKEFFVLLDLYITDMRIKGKHITFPYMQTSHCLKERSSGFKYLDDNGRILAFKGTCHIYLALSEFLLIMEQYDFKYSINASYRAKKDYLPPFMTETIDKSFKGKSDFKNKVSQLKKQNVSRETIQEAETNLMKSKNVLNGIYGCTCTDPIRQDIELVGNTWETKKIDKTTLGEKLDKYYKSRNHCMRYQWGIETTIFARLELMYFIKLIGYENCIYCDTDSIFYYSTPEIEKKIEEYNKRLYDKSIEIGAYITTEKGDTIVYNQFELEKDEDITEFRFLHSKCYAYKTSDGKLHTVIAGVPQKHNGTYREDELGDIENLKDGFVFIKCGGTKAKYIDEQDSTYKYQGNVTCGGCIISQTTKTLNNENYLEREDLFYVER